MASLAQQRCFNHSQREAVARCLGCRQYFCRECVTEHDDRVLCAVCLQKLVKPEAGRRRGFAAVLRVSQCLLSLLLLWFCFYLVGEALVAIPTSFHEGTLWQANWLDEK